MARPLPIVSPGVWPAPTTIATLPCESSAPASSPVHAVRGGARSRRIGRSHRLYSSVGRCSPVHEPYGSAASPARGAPASPRLPRRRARAAASRSPDRRERCEPGLRRDRQLLPRETQRSRRERRDAPRSRSPIPRSATWCRRRSPARGLRAQIRAADRSVPEAARSRRRRSRSSCSTSGVPHRYAPRGLQARRRPTRATARARRWMRSWRCSSRSSSARAASARTARRPIRTSIRRVPFARWRAAHPEAPLRYLVARLAGFQTPLDAASGVPADVKSLIDGAQATPPRDATVLVDEDPRSAVEPPRRQSGAAAPDRDAAARARRSGAPRPERALRREPRPAARLRVLGLQRFAERPPALLRKDRGQARARCSFSGALDRGGSGQHQRTHLRDAGQDLRSIARRRLDPPRRERRRSQRLRAAADRPRAARRSCSATTSRASPRSNRSTAASRISRG